MSSAIWLSVALPVALVTGVLTGALQGRERFALLNSINMVSTLALQILPLMAAIYVSPRLDIVLPAAIAARLLAAGLLALACIRSVPVLKPVWPGAELIKQLLGFGGWVTVTGLVGPIMDTSDRLIIGSASGAAAVSVYTIPMTLLRRGNILAGALSNSLFPRLASIKESSDRERLLVRSLSILAAVLTPPISRDRSDPGSFSHVVD